MLEVCDICGQALRNGRDSKQYIEYDPADRAAFDTGEITLEELNDRAKIFYNRDRLCFNSGNENTLTDEHGNTIRTNPPCPNYYGQFNHTIDDPFVVVEVVKIEDN